MPGPSASGRGRDGSGGLGAGSAARARTTPQRLLQTPLTPFLRTRSSEGLLPKGGRRIWFFFFFWFPLFLSQRSLCRALVLSAWPGEASPRAAGYCGGWRGSPAPQEEPPRSRSLPSSRPGAEAAERLCLCHRTGVGPAAWVTPTA